MTSELMDTLVDHSAGNYRSLMIIGAELLAYGMAHELAQLDEKSYLEVYQPRNSRQRRRRKRRCENANEWGTNASGGARG